MLAWNPGNIDLLDRPIIAQHDGGEDRLPKIAGPFDPLGDGGVLAAANAEIHTDALAVLTEVPAE